MSITSETLLRTSDQAGARHLYLLTAAVLAVIVFAAFTRTFWAPIAAGSLALHPAIVVHAVLFFAWPILFLAQCWLPLAGHTATHRALGLFGIALAALMVFSGILGTIVDLQANLAGPNPKLARTSAVLGFSSMALFTTFFTLAIVNLGPPERHKRLMVLATFSILQAAVARLLLLIPSIGLPLRVTLGAVVVDTLLLAVVALDARARGRAHPTYLAGAALLVLVQFARAELLQTQSWAAFCLWLAELGA